MLYGGYGWFVVPCDGCMVDAWMGQVGAATETELKDKKLRYEDALNSVRSALELGIVPGGGACLQYLQRMGEWAIAVVAVAVVFCLSGVCSVPSYRVV